MMYTGDLGTDMLRQMQLYGCSYITKVGDTETTLIMDYHSALSEAEMLAIDTGIKEFTVCRYSFNLSDDVVQTFWTGHVVDGVAHAFLQEPKHTNLST